jgi:hypothetical protein
MSDGVEQCPRCGNEMETGFLVGRRYINWARRATPAVIVTELLQERLGAGFFTQAAVRASRCSRCRAGAFHY